MVLINGVQMISSNFFASIGKSIKGVFLSLSRQVLFLIPLILILPIFYGIDGILFAAPIADLLAFCVTVLLVKKELAHMKTLDATDVLSAGI